MSAIPISPEVRANTYTKSLERFPKVAADAQGNYVVVWTSGSTAFSSNIPSPDGSGSGVYAQRFQADGTPIGPEFQVNTHIRDWQTVGAVAMDSRGNFVITWTSDDQDGSGAGVYARRYRPDGIPIGDEFQVNTYTSSGQYGSDVAMDDDGNFVVTWMSEGQGEGRFNIFAQRYDRGGAALGEEFQVNTTRNGRDGSQSSPAIAMDANGSFAITWRSRLSDDEEEVLVRRFNADGSPRPLPTGETGDVQVNSFSTGYQGNPDIAMVPSGDFVVTWEGYAASPTGNAQRDNSDYGVYAQRYRANGTKRGIEFRVNSTTEGAQRLPQIAADSDGNFVITWSSRGQDGDQRGIYAQHFRNDGSRWGGEVRVNTLTEDDQAYPSVAMAGNRDFRIAWQNANSSLLSELREAEIYVRQFDTPSRPITGTDDDDTLTGDDGADRISGLAGHDVLRGLGGSDALDGGDGDDYLYGGDGQDSLFGRVGNDYLYGGAGPDTLIGEAGNDTIFGEEDNDYFQGNEGDDYLNGGAGDDVMDGGLGLDRFNGGAGNDTLFGGDGNDTLWGDAGDDIMMGEAGRDTLWGNGGNDRMEGGPGNDIYVIQDMGAIAIERDYGTLTGHTDLAYSSLSTYTLPANIENLSLGGTDDGIVFGGIEGIGNAGDNSIEGNSRDNRLYGRDGSDELSGRAGNDQLFGEAGNDFLFGNEGNDVLRGGAGVDLLEDHQGHNRLYGDGGDDYLWTGAGHDRLEGGAGHDRLEGGAGRDRLEGGSGNDVLIGSVPESFTVQSTQPPAREVDILIGGGGADHFVLGYDDRLAYRNDGRARTKSFAKIKDFRIGEDLIHLGEGSYVLGQSPIRRLSGTGIFLKTQTGGSISKDLVGVVKNIHPHQLDLSNSGQFRIGGNFPVTSEHWAGF